VPFSEERLPPFKSGDQSSGHLGFRSKASCHAFIVPNTTGERTTTDMTVPTGLAVSRDQPLAFASDMAANGYGRTRVGVSGMSRRKPMPPHSTHGRHPVYHGLVPAVSTDEPLPIAGKCLPRPRARPEKWPDWEGSITRLRSPEQFASPGYSLARR
jgi:hypothetical protein